MREHHHDMKTCPVCGDSNAPKRARVLRFLAEHVNTSNSETARINDAARSMVLKWRRLGEEAGCIPRRTLRGRLAQQRLQEERRRRGQVQGLRTGWPIGTIWVGDETMRLA